MKAWIGLVAIAAVVASAMSSRPARYSAQEGQFRLDVSGVAVHAIVRDGNRPVAGLTEQDFALTDSGVRQSVTVVPGSRLPIDLSVVVQQTLFSGGFTRTTYQPQIDEIAGLLTERDRFQLVAVGEDIREIVPLGGTAGTADLAPADTRARCFPLLDAVASILMRPTDPSRQHAVIMLSEGMGGGNVLSYDAIDAIARRSDAVLYALLTEGSTTTGWFIDARYPICAIAEAEWTSATKGPLRAIEAIRSQPWHVFSQFDHERLAKLAAATGGKEIRPALFSKSIAGPVQHVLDELRSSYTLYYQPKDVPTAGWHPISVTLTHSATADVHARPGYAR